MSTRAWQFDVLANVGADDEADGVLELVPATLELDAELELDAAAWLPAVLDPPLEPPQPATSAATATSVTKNFIALTSRAPGEPGTRARP